MEHHLPPIHLPEVHASDHLQPLRTKLNNSSFMLKPPTASLARETEHTMNPDAQKMKGMFTSSLETNSPSPFQLPDLIFDITQHHRPFHFTLPSANILQWSASLCKFMENTCSCWQRPGTCVYHLQPFKAITNSYTFPGVWHDGTETSPFQIPVTTFAVDDLPTPAGELLISK